MIPTAAIVDTLQQLTALAQICGADRAVTELRQTASTIEALGAEGAAYLAQLASDGRFGELTGISPTLHSTLGELASGGAAETLEAARAGVPWLSRRLLELSAVGLGEAVVLARHLNVLTIADLEAALDDGRIAEEIGEDTDSRIRAVADTLRSDVRVLTLGRALDLGETLAGYIARTCPHLDEIVVAGDIRRFEPVVPSIVLVARSSDPPAAVDAVCALARVEDVLHRSARRVVILFQRTEVDLRVAAPEEYGSVLVAATGSRAHLAALRSLGDGGQSQAAEEDVYRHVGLVCIPPEMRHDTGEIEAAAQNRLPRLVTLMDILGDLHMHSTYSDGADTLESMVAASCALGYEYIAITDHSEHAAASRTLTIDRLARQRDEIARLRERYPSIVILHGVETDILPGGRLDFEDAVLESLDIVLASLHDDADHSPERLTRRCIQAIRHPLVTIITHPQNRLVGRRSGYDLDFEAVYAAAAETGTALEVDGAPGHLDLDGEHARAAAGAGVTLTIDSDCHRAATLGRQMRMGVGTARRGWIEPRHVLNTRSVDAVRDFIAKKRAGR